MTGLRVVELVQTCEAAPTQWEGRLADDRPVYIHYRHDALAVHLGAVGGDIDSAVLAEPWWSAANLGLDPWSIPIERVSELTGLLIDCDVGKV